MRAEASHWGHYEFRADTDYRGTFPSGAFYCGYLMWVLEYDGSYLIVREEEGQATPDLLEKASPTDLPGLRRQLGCRD